MKSRIRYAWLGSKIGIRLRARRIFHSLAILVRGWTYISEESRISLFLRVLLLGTRYASPRRLRKSVRDESLHRLDFRLIWDESVPSGPRRSPYWDTRILKAIFLSLSVSYIYIEQAQFQMSNENAKRFR